MKWLAVILSIYMVLLSCIPCADAAPIEDTTKVTHVASQPDTTDHAPAADLCSPLCICNCCAGFALQTNLKKVNPTFFIALIPAPIYRHVAVLQPSFAIWQPPKI